MKKKLLSILLGLNIALLCTTLPSVSIKASEDPYPDMYEYPNYAYITIDSTDILQLHPYERTFGMKATHNPGDLYYEVEVVDFIDFINSGKTRGTVYHTLTHCTGDTLWVSVPNLKPSTYVVHFQLRTPGPHKYPLDHRDYTFVVADSE